jgi:tRNA1Val (adenine37-N6)-methyltransferase
MARGTDRAKCGDSFQIRDLSFVERSFKFKYFSIEDDRSTMKVGTDAVLLGAWAKVDSATRILDVGTGSGVIALMMAQRSGFDAHVEGVEPDVGSAMQAKENVERSPWPDKVTIHNNPIQEFHPTSRYDLIVTNPPFFRRSLLPSTQTRQMARHTETLSFDDLLMAVKRLLSADGTFASVLPVAEGNQFREEAERYGLVCHRSMAFFSRKGKPQERWCMEFAFSGTRKAVVSETVVLYEDGEHWTDRYAELTREFYLR